MDAKLLDILVCPLCKGEIQYSATDHELLCKRCKLTFPIRDDIPILLEEEASPLAEEETA